MPRKNLKFKKCGYCLKEYEYFDKRKVLCDIEEEDDEKKENTE